MNIFWPPDGAHFAKVVKCLPLLMASVLVWSCHTVTEDPEQKEHALYRDITDQLAWQTIGICDNSPDAKASVNQPPDSVKKFMRTQGSRRVLYYQPKIGARRKMADLADLITVEVLSWERFYSTFSGIPAKQILESVTVSSALEAADFGIDYLDIVKLDTTSNAPRDSSLNVVGFSKPFYKKEKNRAVVYFEVACGSKGVRGELLMVRFKDDKWLIEERRLVWMAH